MSKIINFLDKAALMNTFPKNPSFVILLEQVIMSILLTIYLMKKEKNTWVLDLKNNFTILFINSLVYLLVAFLVIFAYIDGPTALVIGIKRLQIFFILILSYILFKDKPTRHSWIATAFMVLGVLMIRLG